MNTKKIIAIIAIPVFAFVLSGCGKKDNAEPQQNTAQTTNDTVDVAPPAAPGSGVPQTQAKDELPALPADSKTAIDQESNAIDQQLQSVADDMDSTELSDSQMGL